MGNKQSCFGGKKRPSEQYCKPADPVSPTSVNHAETELLEIDSFETSSTIKESDIISLSESDKADTETFSTNVIESHSVVTKHEPNHNNFVAASPFRKENGPSISSIDQPSNIVSSNICECSSSSRISSLFSFESSDSENECDFAPQVVVAENMSIESFSKATDFTENLDATEEVIEKVENSSITNLFDEEYEAFLKTKDENERLIKEEQEIMEKEMAEKEKEREKQRQVQLEILKGALDKAKKESCKKQQLEKPKQNQSQKETGKNIVKNLPFLKNNPNEKKLESQNEILKAKQVNEKEVTKQIVTVSEPSNNGLKRIPENPDNIEQSGKLMPISNEKRIGESQLSDDEHNIVQSAASVIQLVTSSNDHIRKPSNHLSNLPPLTENSRFEPTAASVNTNIFPVTFETISEDKVADFAESSSHDNYITRFENAIDKCSNNLFLLPTQTQSEKNSLSNSPNMSPHQSSHLPFETFGKNMGRNNINNKAAIPKVLNSNGMAQAHFRHVIANESTSSGLLKGRVSPVQRTSNPNRISPFVSTESLNGQKLSGISKQTAASRKGTSGNENFPSIPTNSFLSTRPCLTNNGLPTGTSSQKGTKQAHPKFINKQNKLKKEILSSNNLSMNKIEKFLDSREHIDKTEFDVVVRSLIEQKSSVYPEARGTVIQQCKKPVLERPLYNGRNLAGSRFPIVGGENKLQKLDHPVDDRIRKNVRTIYATLPKTTISSHQVKVDRQDAKSPLSLLYSNNVLKDTNKHHDPAATHERSKVYDRGKVTCETGQHETASGIIKIEAIPKSSSLKKASSSNSSCVGLPPINRVPLVSVGLPACSMTSIRLRNFPSVEDTPYVKKKKEVRFNIPAEDVSIKKTV